jgi:dipeptidase D
MENLKELGDPLDFWEYFYTISKIPRCSEHEEHIRNFVLKEAEKMGFNYEKDEIGNIVVRVPYTSTTKKDILRVVLQCHMDMVCEKNEGNTHDFSKDPLKLKLIEIEGKKWLTANGTTLGADNGIGIAYNLAIMKKLHDGSLDLGPLELDLLFTVDEEQGLTGASKINKSLISGKYLLNLDSEEDDKFTIGCAGGRVFTIEIKLEDEQLIDIQKPLSALRIDILGLLGGHSGTDINKRRGNAIKILAEILWKLNTKYSIYIKSLEGGNKSNAIPREAHAIFYTNKAQNAEIKGFIEIIFSNIKKLYAGSDSNLTISIEELDNAPETSCFSKDFQLKFINILHLMPSGSVSLHPTSNGLVHTSLNLASIHTLENLIKIQISTRSLTEYDKDMLFEKVQTLLGLSQLDTNIIINTVYPSWPPNFDSELVKKSKKIYKEMFNEEVTIQAIHAGLECAYFAEYFPEMEMISLGPNVIGNHSPDERLDIQSVVKVWNYLISLLKNLT